MAKFTLPSLALMVGRGWGATVEELAVGHKRGAWEQVVGEGGAGWALWGSWQAAVGKAVMGRADAAPRRASCRGPARRRQTLSAGRAGE